VRLLLTLLRWVASKFATGLLIVILGVTACALWVYLRDNVDFDQWRQDMVRTLTGQRTKLKTALADVHERLDQISGTIAADREKEKQAEKVIDGLTTQRSSWDRYFGDREQQLKIEARLIEMNALRDSLEAEIQRKQEEFTHTTWERDGLEIALGKLDAKIQAIEARRSKVMHYLELAWNYPIGHGWLRWPVKTWVFLVLGLYFIGPTLGKLAMYFIVAPIIVRGRPVRLDVAAKPMPAVGRSEVAVDLGLDAGERLWIKEKFLQASDEGLRRKTRYVLDWRLPLTCLATGLIELVEMSNAAPTATDLRVTLSNQADPHSELAVITLAEGAALVLRPSYLAGAIVGGGKRLDIRRRWQLFRWQAWVTLQFRFFEFHGPCRLIVAGSRGVRAENLVDRVGPDVPARRTNQDATLGFTPNLDYRPVRAETFWSYYRGMNPLFDDLFVGRGIFLCQQVASDGEARQARKFWSGVWAGVLKVFGL
jgi:hypothetical protein